MDSKILDILRQEEWKRWVRYEAERQYGDYESRCRAAAAHQAAREIREAVEECVKNGRSRSLGDDN